jgi:hypothetical protein
MQVFIELIGPRDTTGPLQLPKVRRSFRAGRAAGRSSVQRVSKVLQELLLRHLMRFGGIARQVLITRQPQSVLDAPALHLCRLTAQPLLCIVS